MFDEIFDDKQWKKSRDATGLKGGLTEKVSMGDEFKAFQKKKTVAAAKVLLQKVTLYEKQLKEKHSQEKYYAKLLKVVQEQKTALENGIAQSERPTLPNGQVMSDPDMDDLVDEIIDREKQHLKQYENRTNDPNTPAFHNEARRVYLKLTKEFKSVEQKMKGEQAAAKEVLQKSKTLESSPNLSAKPENAVIVAQKILEALDKIVAQALELLTDFVTEGQVVRKQEGAQANATKELDKLNKKLTEIMDEVNDAADACRASLKKTLAGLGNHTQAQALLRNLP